MKVGLFKVFNGLDYNRTTSGTTSGTSGGVWGGTCGYTGSTRFNYFKSIILFYRGGCGTNGQGRGKGGNGTGTYFLFGKLLQRTMEQRLHTILQDVVYLLEQDLMTKLVVVTLQYLIYLQDVVYTLLQKDNMTLTLQLYMKEYTLHSLYELISLLKLELAYELGLHVYVQLQYTTKYNFNIIWVIFMVDRGTGLLYYYWGRGAVCYIVVSVGIVFYV